MSIRFPKRNIAQQQADRRRKETLRPIEEEPVGGGIEIPQVPTRSDIVIPTFELGPHTNNLYPTRLHRLHEDIELLGKLSSLPSKVRKDLQKRLPHSLVLAEAKADKMLEDFVRHEVEHRGQEAYGRRLKEAMTPTIQVMLALRCWIAARTVDAPKNTIKIYRNKVMEAWEFFPESSRKSFTDPITGEVSMMIDYETDDKAPYKRQEEVVSKRHYEVMSITESGPKKIDRMPKDWGLIMGEVLQGFGYEINSIDDAWKTLDKVSKNATIEERILSKISYLITHATVHKKNKMLPG